MSLPFGVKYPSSNDPIRCRLPSGSLHPTTTTPPYLHLDGENLTALPLVDRKARLASLLNGAPEFLRYNDHQIGHGPTFHRLACEHGVEGVVSKRTNGRYEPDQRTWPQVN